MQKPIAVIKFGGNALTNDSILHFCTSVYALTQKGITPIVVHGGGPQINHYLAKLNIKPHFVDGLRYTDKPTLEAVEMVLSGHVNKKIVQGLNRQKVSAVGISGKDADTLVAQKCIKNQLGENIDIGWVGEINHVNIQLIQTLIQNNLVPVIAPIATNSDNTQTYNINADFAATAIAKALCAKHLVLMTNIDGLMDANQKLIHQTNRAQIEQLMNKKVIRDGMIPKIQSALDALKQVNEVNIINGEIPDSLIDLFNQQTVGTKITQ